MNFLNNIASVDELAVFDFAAVKLTMDGVFDSRISELKKLKAELLVVESLAVRKKSVEKAELELKNSEALLNSERAKVNSYKAELEEVSLKHRDRSEELHKIEVWVKDTQQELEKREVALRTKEAGLCALQEHLEIGQRKLSLDRENLDSAFANLNAQVEVFNKKLESLRG